MGPLPSFPLLASPGSPLQRPSPGTATLTARSMTFSRRWSTARRPGPRESSGPWSGVLPAAWSTSTARASCTWTSSVRAQRRPRNAALATPPSHHRLALGAPTHRRHMGVRFVPANNVLLRRAGYGLLVPQICDFGSALYLGDDVRCTSVAPPAHCLRLRCAGQPHGRTCCPALIAFVARRTVPDHEAQDRWHLALLAPLAG